MTTRRRVRVRERDLNLLTWAALYLADLIDDGRVSDLAEEDEYRQWAREARTAAARLHVGRQRAER